MADVHETVAAIRAGEPVILPTDTVYGLCATPYVEEAATRVYRLKGRPDAMPSALVCRDLDTMFDCVPELYGQAGVYAQALLPGPYTLVLPNPARRFRWLTGDARDTIGIRVPGHTTAAGGASSARSSRRRASATSGCTSSSPRTSSTARRAPMRTRTWRSSAGTWTRSSDTWASSKTQRRSPGCCCTSARVHDDCGHVRAPPPVRGWGSARHPRGLRYRPPAHVSVSEVRRFSGGSTRRNG